MKKGMGGMSINNPPDPEYREPSRNDADSVASRPLPEQVSETGNGPVNEAESRIIFQDLAKSTARVPRDAFLIFRPTREGCFP